MDCAEDKLPIIVCFVYCYETMERNFKVTFVLVALMCFSLSANWYQLFVTFLQCDETIV